LNAYYLLYNRTQSEHKKVRKYNLPVRIVDAIDTLKRYKRLKRDAIERRPTKKLWCKNIANSALSHSWIVLRFIGHYWNSNIFPICLKLIFAPVKFFLFKFCDLIQQ